MKYYVIGFDCGSPWCSQSFLTVGSRDKEARKIFNSADYNASEACIGWMDIDEDGKPNVGTYTDEDLE